MADKHLQVGEFRRLAAADKAVAALVDAGFPEDSITVICPSCAADHFVEGVHQEKPPSAREPAAIATGSAIGGLLGGLTAAVGLAATGGTALLVAGPLFGAAAAGGVVGGLLGAMVERGVEPDVADYYDQAVRRGSILVAVETSPEGTAQRDAQRILAQAGAEPLELRNA